jgi:hypothetical protein
VSALVVADAPDAMGEMPGHLLAHQLDVTRALPAVTLLGFPGRPSMDALEAAAAALLDAQPERVVAMGLHVARALGMPQDVPPLRWHPLATGTLVAWTPLPRTRWWTKERTEAARRWFMAIFDLPAERAGVSVAPLPEPPQHPARASATLDERRRAFLCVKAAAVVAGVRPMAIKQRDSTRPDVVLGRRLVSHLARWNDVRDTVLAVTLGVSVATVRNDRYQARDAIANDRSVASFAVQADQAFELLDQLAFLRNLERRQERLAG